MAQPEKLVMIPTTTKNSRHIFPFERLPAELRVVIYEELFVCPHPLYITTRKTNPASTGKTSHQTHVVTFPNHRGRRPTKTARSSPFLRAGDTSLLRTDRATYHEILPIIYAQNKFVAHEEADLRRFTHTAYHGIPLIQHLTIDFDLPPTFRAGDSLPPLKLDLLYPFTGLRAFRWGLPSVRAHVVFPPRKARELVELAEDFVCMGATTWVERRRRFGVIGFVCHARMIPARVGRPAHGSAGEVLRVVKVELERLLVESGVLEAVK